MTKQLLLALLLSVYGCAHKVVVKPVTEIVRGAGWAARQDAPDAFVVWVHDGVAERLAKEEICSASYICTEESWGRIIILRRIRK